MATCWVHRSCWPHNIKQPQFVALPMEIFKRDTINQPIGILKNANEIASRMLMRRFHQHVKAGTQCANFNKYGQLYSHVVFIIKHPCGLLAISTEISPIQSLRKHEKFAYAHTLQPWITDMIISTVLKELMRHMGPANLTHEQRFLKHCTQKTAEPPPRVQRRKKQHMPLPRTACHVLPMPQESR